jgi:chemotaxis response regulator CheB
VVTCTDEARDVLAEIGSICPDVIILDFSQQGRDGLNQSTEDWYTYAATLVCFSETIFSTAAVTAGSE